MAIEPERLQMMLQLMQLMGNPMQDLGGLMGLQQNLAEQNLTAQQAAEESRTTQEQLELAKKQMQHDHKVAEQKLQLDLDVANFNRARSDREFQAERQEAKRANEISLRQLGIEKDKADLLRQQLDDRAAAAEVNADIELMQSAGATDLARRVAEKRLKERGVLPPTINDLATGLVGFASPEEEQVFEMLQPFQRFLDVIAGEGEVNTVKKELQNAISTQLGGTSFSGQQ